MQLPDGGSESTTVSITLGKTDVHNISNQKKKDFFLFTEMRFLNIFYCRNAFLLFILYHRNAFLLYFMLQKCIFTIYFVSQKWFFFLYFFFLPFLFTG